MYICIRTLYVRELICISGSRRIILECQLYLFTMTWVLGSMDQIQVSRLMWPTPLSAEWSWHPLRVDFWRLRTDRRKNNNWFQISVLSLFYIGNRGETGFGRERDQLFSLFALCDIMSLKNIGTYKFNWYFWCAGIPCSDHQRYSIGCLLSQNK